MKDEIFHYISEEETFAKRINARLEDCKEAIIASAFFTNGAFNEFKPYLESALESGAKITFLLGRFDFVTEPKAVKGLLHFASKYPKQLSIYFDGNFYFHFKLARFKTHDAAVVFIGSSNLTPKGLASTGEVNLEIVNNAGVFKQAGKILSDRIQVALDAGKYLDEYRRKYNQAQKYRRQRYRWETSGRDKLTNRGSVKRNRAEPRGDKYMVCWIDDVLEDELLEKNIDREHRKSIAGGLNFPNQWVYFERKSEIRNYSDNQVFIVVDNLEHRMGFARCTKIILVMDSRGSERPVLFYRYLSGWRAQFNKASFETAVTELGFNDSIERIEKKVSIQFGKYMKDYRNRKSSGSPTTR